MTRSSRPRRRGAIADPRRFAPLVGIALAAFAAGLIVGAAHVPSERRAATAFARAWEHGDYDGMYALLSDAARRRTSRARLERTYRDAAQTLTLSSVKTGRAREDGDRVRVAVTLQTRIFGRWTGDVALPTGDRADGGPGIDWRAELVYPGLRRGERLRRETVLAPRATIQGRDGTAIARGPERLSDLGPLASEIAGRIGPASPERAAELAERGIPPGAAARLTRRERAVGD